MVEYIFLQKDILFTFTCSLDCLFEPTQYLHHDFEAKVIPANHAVDITFSFYPREARKYKETIVFEVNGLSREKVDILGIGTEMKVQFFILFTLLLVILPIKYLLFVFLCCVSKRKLQKSTIELCICVCYAYGVS